MAAAESELSEIQRAQADLCAKITVDRDIASGVYQSALKLISEDERRAAQVRLDRLNAEAVRLERSARAVRARMQEYSVANKIAVRDAITPLRKAAAERVASSIAQLTAAIAALNSTGLCLKEAGVDAVRVPEPLLSGMDAIAKSIITATSPELEKR
ncbi:hypothetical protein V5279_23905 [Bradyrhizobium sp. 26S5]|uniref:hypothetical protein n=1 Tax=Bradyrhizobium sp. 26S5 TaxID=3139729 RepID=UPI0030CF6F05